MNIAGIGIDAVNVTRFKQGAEEHGEHFLAKIFTEKERDHASTKQIYYRHMAGKFAAKEAVKKALPSGAEIGLRWTDIEILNHDDGRPYAVLHGHASRLMKRYKLEQVFVSISHTKDLATANAVVMQNVS
jgi:holo-[acyl-carrier protein] synthase